MSVLSQFDLSGKSALITGGSRGIGLAIAAALKECGAHVTLAARRMQWLDPALSELNELGGDASEGVELDVSDNEQVTAVVKTVADRRGLDIVVNSAGITWGDDSVDYPPEKWDQVLRVNLTGTWFVSQAAAPYLTGRPGAAILNISSAVAQVGLDSRTHDAVAYNASKGGVDALTRDIAMKWAARGIRVNALAPGYFRTRMTEAVIDADEEGFDGLSPMGRIGQLREIQGAALFLVSPASSFVTGQVLNVDGGLSVWAHA